MADDECVACQGDGGQGQMMQGNMFWAQFLQKNFVSREPAELGEKVPSHNVSATDGKALWHQGIRGNNSAEEAAQQKKATVCQ